MMKMTSADVAGKSVIGQHGRNLGEVADLVVDVESWHVVGLDVKLHREIAEQLGRHKPLLGNVTVQIGSEHVSGVGDQIVLKVSLEELAALVGKPRA